MPRDTGSSTSVFEFAPEESEVAAPQVDDAELISSSLRLAGLTPC